MLHTVQRQFSVGETGPGRINPLKLEAVCVLTKSNWIAELIRWRDRFAYPFTNSQERRTIYNG